METLMTRGRVAGLSLLLVLVAALVFAPAARADSQVRIVRLSLVDGPVQIDRGGGQGLEKAIMNMPITQGMKVSTQDDGRAEVEFEDGTSLRMAPRTEVEFPSLGLRSSGGRFTTVLVDQGTAYFNVRHKGDDQFRVEFAGREINVDHNVHFRLDLAGGNPELAVFKGELNLKGPEGHVTVKKNETLAFDSSDAGRYDLAKNITPESYDQWDNERLNYASQYASRSYGTRSPYYYGASDLNYYGSWYNSPGYGSLWQPYGVGYGWDPFSNGAWAWYPGFGYTWVSTYPWGWTPYRYGSWIFVPNFGWCWRPGVWNTWYTVPPVYNAPPSYHAPRPPVPVPVTVVGAGGTTRHPTIFVDNGVGIIRDRRDGIVTGKSAGTTIAAPASSIAAGSTLTSAPARTVAPAPGTGIAAPGSPMPMRRSDARSRMADQDRPMRMGPSAGGPPARVERSAPAMRSAPAAPRSAPAPRMSAPAPRMSAPPARSAPPSGDSRPPK